MDHPGTCDGGGSGWDFGESDDGEAAAAEDVMIAAAADEDRREARREGYMLDAEKLLG
jgi:hypothetical protein